MMKKFLLSYYKNIKKIFKQGKCNHCISENYLSSSSCGPKVRDNYCCYTCMLCYKQIKFLGKKSNQTTTHNLQPNE